MTTFAYIRVSTGRQELSPDAQEKAIRDYCALYNLPAPEIVRDIAQSAATMNRPGLQQIIAAVRGYEAKPGQSMNVVAYKLDRLFRSTREALEAFELFEAHGVALHLVQERIDTSSAMGRFVRVIMLALGQLEREQTGERTSFALQSKRAQHGGQINGQAPYGSMWQGGKLVDDPTEAPARDLIIRMRGSKPARVIDALRAISAPTRTGAPWSARTIANIQHRAAMQRLTDAAD